MHVGFSKAISPFCEKIKSVAEKGHNAYVLTHLNADGLISGGIVSTTLIRLGAKCVTRALHHISPGFIREIKSDPNDFFILCDIGMDTTSTLANELGNRWIVINHHRPPMNDELGSLYDSNILNAFKINIDGECEISSGGLAYLLSTQIERSNWDLSPIAIVSALANNQDCGDKKMLTGLNSEIMKVAQSHELLSVELNLRFTGRETKPIHEAIASTLIPFMDGITGNTDNAYSVLKNSGVKLIENGRWRVPAELGQEENSVILEAIVKFISTVSRFGSANLADELVGYTYTLSSEDLRSPLRDAREFSAVLSACGKIGRTGVGVGICLGDRNYCLREGDQIANQFRTILHKGVSSILAENWRISLDKFTVFLNGENILDEGIVEYVGSIISRSLIFGDRANILWTRASDGMNKIYYRACPDSKSEADLNVIVKTCAKSAGGSAEVNHDNEGVCRIPSAGFEAFLSCMKRVIIEFNTKNYA
jgi:RecJ-like exonuclease